MSHPVIWQPRWDALLGTAPDRAIARELGVSDTSVRDHRNKAGIKPFAGKRRAVCSSCAQIVYRVQVKKLVICKRCTASRMRQRAKEYYVEHKLEVLKKTRVYVLANPKKKLRWSAKYRRNHREQIREKENQQRKADKDLLAQLPCLDCGMHHNAERRESIVRRMLPAGAVEIHEAWPCIWGPGGRENKSTAGAMRLYRDLRAVGAIRSGNTWYPPAEARSAA